LSLIRRRTVILFAALGVAIYVAVALATDAGKLASALRQLGWIGIGSVLALSLFNYLVRFGRWKLYLEALGHRLPARELLLCYLGGFAFTVSPGRAGEAVRSLYLREHGVTYSESMATLFVERLLDLLTMIVLASLVVLVSSSYSWLLIGMAVIAIVALLVVCRPALPDWLARHSDRRAGHRSSKWLAALAKLLRSSRTLLHPRLLLLGMLLGLLAWGAEGVGFHLVCRGLDLRLEALQAIGIYAVATLTGVAAVFLPAGIGGMEAVMTALLLSRGASVPDAVIATLLCRLATLWFAVLIGLAATGLMELFKTAAPPVPRTSRES
jgi:glycosyltransferase 2 family protein